MREVLNRRLKPAFRNEANEPPVVKNVCAVLTGRKPKHASMSRARAGPF